MSSSFRAQAIAGRVVITHRMPEATVITELDARQADLLLQQLETALNRVVRQADVVATLDDVLAIDTVVVRHGA
jgi:hypothetical protein